MFTFEPLKSLGEKKTNSSKTVSLLIQLRVERQRFNPVFLFLFLTQKTKTKPTSKRHQKQRFTIGQKNEFSASDLLLFFLFAVCFYCCFVDVVGVVVLGVFLG